MKKNRLFFSIVGAPILVWIFPVFFLYTKNVKEMQIIEIFKPCLIFVSCCFVLLLVGRLLFKSWEAAGIFGFVNGIFLGNFSLILNAIQRALPIVRYWHLLFLVIVFAYIIGKVIAAKKDLASDILRIIIMVFGVLMAFNFITAVPTIITKISVSLHSKGSSEQNDYAVIDGKRNIYYLLCDEYASFAQLEEDFGYGNLDFKARLQDLGFNISENSYNDCHTTVVVMANVMQLNYVATLRSTSVELQELTQNGMVQKILTENGYRLQGIGDTGWLGIEGTVETEGKAVTAEGTDVAQVAFDHSFLGMFLKRNYSEDALKIVTSLEKLNQMDITPDSSMFTMFYIPAPHHPYYLKSDGSMNPPEKWRNDSSGKNNDAYLGEVEYVNATIYPALERIIENDPNAIILLCSDHGNRFGTVSEPMKNRILNTLYYHGEVIDEFEGMSGVNTLRYIFNREFDMNLPFISLPDEE